MSTLAEVEELQARRKEERAKAEEAQRVLDLTAKMALEDEHVTSAIAAVSVSRFVPGQPTQAFVRTPKPVEYKRYLDQVQRASQAKNNAGIRQAQELMANACWVYPTTDEDRKSMLEAFPGILTPIALAATALAEGRNEEEGKG